MLNTFCVRLNGPESKLVLFCRGTSIRLATGFCTSFCSFASAVSGALCGPDAVGSCATTRVTRQNRFAHVAPRALSLPRIAATPPSPICPPLLLPSGTEGEAYAILHCTVLRIWTPNRSEGCQSDRLLRWEVYSIMYSLNYAEFPQCF